jgi:hypothetical protein
MWLVFYFVMKFMPINSIKLVHMIIYRCQCRYGPNDLTNVIKDITQNHNVCPKKLDIDGKIISSNIGHKDTWDSKRKWGGSIKKGWKAEFTIRTLYLFKHVNQDGLHVHGDLKMGDSSTFVAHLS